MNKVKLSKRENFINILKNKNKKFSTPLKVQKLLADITINPVRGTDCNQSICCFAGDLSVPSSRLRLDKSITTVTQRFYDLYFSRSENPNFNNKKFTQTSVCFATFDENGNSLGQIGISTVKDKQRTVTRAPKEVNTNGIPYNIAYTSGIYKEVKIVYEKTLPNGKIFFEFYADGKD